MMKFHSGTVTGKLVDREEPCRICNERRGIQVALVDYWDIKTSRLVRCPVCNLIQLDPMLSLNETYKGCYAFFLDDMSHSGRNVQIISCLRNFRRGVVFGNSLKKIKINPSSVLEIGPGSGYFSWGLKFVFPDVEVSVLDIVENVTNFNRTHHNFKSIIQPPETFNEELVNKFDLVIARDVIEHVRDISAVIKNIFRYLRPGGYFHFITPNGKEDVWQHYLTSSVTGLASELLLNHVNYFDGSGLKQLLNKEGFTTVKYYTFKIRTALKGKGWARKRSLMSPVSTRKNAEAVIKEKAGNITSTDFNKKEVLDRWYINDNAKWITHAFSLYQHYAFLRLNPELNIGHEFYGLFRRE